MDSNSPFRFIVKPILFLLEYGFKVSAGVVALIVLGASGSFFAKLGTGFGSLVPTFRHLLEAPQRYNRIADIIRDYNTMTASAFNERYGGQAVNRVLESLNDSVAYFQAVYQNVTQEPVSTVIATLLAFLILYLLGRAMRFTRQRGQGSYVDRLERRLGNRFFKDKDTDRYSDYA